MEIFLVGGAIFLLVLFIYKASKPNPEPVMLDYSVDVEARKQEIIREAETKASLPDRIEAARVEIQALVDKHNREVEEQNAEKQKEFETALAAYNKALESPVNFDDYFTFEQQFLTVGDELIPALYIQKIWIRGEVREPIMENISSVVGSRIGHLYDHPILWEVLDSQDIMDKYDLIEYRMHLRTSRVKLDAFPMLDSFKVSSKKFVSHAYVNICIEIASGKIIEMECPTPQAERIHERMREEWKRTINSMPLMEVRDALGVTE